MTGGANAAAGSLRANQNAATAEEAAAHRDSVASAEALHTSKSFLVVDWEISIDIVSMNFSGRATKFRISDESVFVKTEFGCDWIHLYDPNLSLVRCIDDTHDVFAFAKSSRNH